MLKGKQSKVSGFDDSSTGVKQNYAGSGPEAACGRGLHIEP